MYKLLKSLYGLKQALIKWNERLCAALFEFSFVRSINDFYLVVKSRSECFVVLLVYVDDMILIGNSLDEIDKVKCFLKSKFRIKDLGKLIFFLVLKMLTLIMVFVYAKRNIALNWFMNLEC